MPSVIDLQRINSLNRIIAREGLHRGDPRDPVIPSSLLRDVSWYYGLVGRDMLAVTQRWRRGRSRYTDVAFNGLLGEPEWSAENRRAVVHEWAHIFCKHRGDMFILWQEGRDVDPLDCFLDNYQERQCEYIAAYMLVRHDALLAMHGEASGYIARQIDVPVHLIELRWWVLSKFGK